MVNKKGYATDGRDQQIGSANDVCEISRSRVTERDRGMGVDQHGRHGSTKNRAATEHHRVRTIELDLVFCEQPHDPFGRTRRKRRHAEDGTSQGR